LRIPALYEQTFIKITSDELHVQSLAGFKYFCSDFQNPLVKVTGYDDGVVFYSRTVHWHRLTD